jgi:hypothetical protein
MTLCFFSHRKVIQQIWIFSQYSLKLMTELEAYSFGPITHRIYSLQLVWVKIHVTVRVHHMQLLDMPNAWACLCEIASDCGQRMQTLRQCSLVCKLKTIELVSFYAWLNLLCATALPFDGLHLEMGPPVDSVHTKICAESVRINRCTAHTLSLTSQHTMSANFKGHHFSSNTFTQW